MIIRIVGVIVVRVSMIRNEMIKRIIFMLLVHELSWGCYGRFIAGKGDPRNNIDGNQLLREFGARYPDNSNIICVIPKILIILLSFYYFLFY